ncbi:uncharacterized protein LOC142341012 [Convolutriloba macropyga]|uniref:uncharacterized protein LOC142341012 n=1 Tax=Convolutriloba macropyga TaxID=536237 RepID=UPI003F51B994
MTIGNDSLKNIWREALAYSKTECQVIMVGFGISGLIGSIFHIFVLSVLIYKMKREIVRSASDQFFVFLTITDLAACSLVFPMEFIHFGSDDCNTRESGVLFALTLFLEILSVLSLQSIAVNRFLLVWKSNYVVFNFTRSCLLSVINVAVSAIIVVIIILNQDQYASILDLYTLFIMGNLLIMVIIYCSIFVKLCQRVAAQNHRNNQNFPQRQNRRPIIRLFSRLAANHHIEENNNHFPTCARSEPTPMEQMRNRSAVISVVITAVYMVCFLPLGTLTLALMFKPEILFNEEPDYGFVICLKYMQLVYNLNFIITPLIYAVMSQQFRSESLKLFHAVRRNSSIPIVATNAARRETNVASRLLHRQTIESVVTSALSPPTNLLKTSTIQLSEQVIVENDV